MAMLVSSPSYLSNVEPLDASAPPSIRGGNPPPITRVQLTSTADRDVAAGAFGNLYADARLEADPRGPFHCALDVVSFGPVRSVRGQWSGGVSVTGAGVDQRFVLSLGEAGQFTGTHGALPFEVNPGRRGMLFSPERAFRLQSRAPLRARSLVFDAALVQAHFRTLTGRDAPEKLTFEGPLSFEEGAGPSLFSTAWMFEEELGRPGASASWLITLRDTLLSGLLLHARHTATPLLEAPPLRVAPGCVRRAEEFMAAHAAERISLADIVAAADVPERSLRAAFQASRGQSPMAVLRRHRMELARSQLAAPSPGTTVAQVVSALGLGNPGRFSIEYRKCYGESPSDTLDRGLAVAGLPRRRPR